MNERLNTVLFDLDGTLLPIDLDAFTKMYLGELARVCAPKLGCPGEEMIAALWSGTKEMLKNDGAASNRERFWDKFLSMIKTDSVLAEEVTDAFYMNEFNIIKDLIGDARVQAGWIKTLKDKGYTLILATNPLFPEVAVKSRLRWLGINMDDFAHVTHYANSFFCKPDARYYERILEEIGRLPEECIMVGNNMHEDMCAARLGLDTYLIIDYLENPEDMDISAHKNGSGADFSAFVESLPTL